MLESVCSMVLLHFLLRTGENQTVHHVLMMETNGWFHVFPKQETLPSLSAQDRPPKLVLQRYATAATFTSCHIGSNLFNCLNCDSGRMSLVFEFAVSISVEVPKVVTSGSTVEVTLRCILICSCLCILLFTHSPPTSFVSLCRHIF